MHSSRLYCLTFVVKWLQFFSHHRRYKDRYLNICLIVVGCEKCRLPRCDHMAQRQKLPSPRNQRLTGVGISPSPSHLLTSGKCGSKAGIIETRFPKCLKMADTALWCQFECRWSDRLFTHRLKVPGCDRVQGRFLCAIHIHLYMEKGHKLFQFSWALWCSYRYQLPTPT